jgi:hypothetical protein
MKVQRKIKYVLPIILALALLASVTQVHAATYYNWILNPSFEGEGVNLITNAGFETGDFTNWTSGGGASVGVAYQHGGSYGARLTDAGNNWFNQSFADTPSESISNFGFYAKRTGAVDVAVGVSVTFTYNDSSSDVQTFTLNVDGDWHRYNYTAEFDAGKFVYDFKVAYVDGGTSRYAYLDDFVCMTSFGEGQTTVSPGTFPWFNIDLLNWNTADGIAVYGIAHEGVCSYYYAGDTGYTGTFYLYQSIPMLLSNFVENCSFWAYESTTGCSVKFHVVYGDGYQNIDTFSFDSVETWQQFNVTVLPNRVIETIALEFVGSTAAYPIYVDDVSLLAIVPYGQSCFTWYVTPPPISFDNYSFSTYITEAHIFYGFVHAENDTVCGSGSFSVTSTYGGIQSGSIINGAFNFPVSARLTLLTDTAEDFIISIVSDVGNFTVTVRANWQYVYVEGSGGLPIYLPTLLNGILIFGVVFAPPLIISIIVRKVKGDAMVGFIAGLALSIVAGVITGVVPLWGLFIMTLALAYCIFAKVREK